MKWFDSLVNLVAQLGTEKSKSYSDTFSLRQMSPVELSAMYRSDWLGRKIIDVPVFDMLREWRDWQAGPAEIEAMEAAEDKWKVRQTVGRALQLARLYGGSGILIGADVSRPGEELRPLSLGKGSLKYLTALSSEDIKCGDLDRDPQSTTYGLPKFYTISAGMGGSVDVHPSRILRFIGADRLETLTVTDGWGDSILASVYDAIHHAALSQSGIAELIHEAKVDVIRIPNLGANFATEAATTQLVKRFTTANTLKSINNMLLLDIQEEWDRKQTSFAGMPEVLDRYMQIVAGASDIPATRLLGMAPKGMSSTGESDLRNYYDMLAGQRHQMLGQNLKALDRILWLDAIGRIPKDAYFEWRPLWQMSDKESADVSKVRADTTKIYAELGLIDENALREGVQNQLIEDGVYPGLEKAIEQLRLAGADPAEDPEAENDNPPADRTLGNGRNRLPRRA